MSDDEFQQLRAFYQPRNLRKKEVLVQAGEICNEQAYISSGCMRSFLTDDRGNEHVIQFGFEDWYVGDMMSFITAKPADYTIEALEDCVVLVFHRDQSDELYARFPRMERYFRIMIQHAFVAMQGRLISTMSQSAETRYLNLLEKFPKIELRVAQHHIASYLGITPEALSRVRRKLLNK